MHLKRPASTFSFGALGEDLGDEAVRLLSATLLTSLYVYLHREMLGTDVERVARSVRELRKCSRPRRCRSLARSRGGV